MCYFENSLIYATLNLLLSIRCKYVFIVLSTAVGRLPIAPICPRIKVAKLEGRGPRLDSVYSLGTRPSERYSVAWGLGKDAVSLQMSPSGLADLWRRRMYRYIDSKEKKKGRKNETISRLTCKLVSEQGCLFVMYLHWSF